MHREANKIDTEVFFVFCFLVSYVNVVALLFRGRLHLSFQKVKVMGRKKIVIDIQITTF